MVVVLAVASAFGIWAMMSALDPRNPQLATPESVVQLAPIPKLKPNTDPNTVDVLVATEDLPAGTVITPKNIGKLVAWKRIAKEDAAYRTATDEKRLHNTRVWLPLQEGEIISVWKVHSDPAHIPEGKVTVAIKFAFQPAAGLDPGYRADIVVMFRLKKRLEAFVVAQDVLIMAIGKGDTWPIGLLAVTPKEKELIEFALTRQSSFEAVWIHPESPPNTEPVDFDGAKKLLEEAPPKTPSQP
jgi:Flp pilus assembly protein CpaB